MINRNGRQDNREGNGTRVRTVRLPRRGSNRAANGKRATSRGSIPVCGSSCAVIGHPSRHSPPAAALFRLVEVEERHAHRLRLLLHGETQRRHEVIVRACGSVLADDLPLTQENDHDYRLYRTTFEALAVAAHSHYCIVSEKERADVSLSALRAAKR